MSSLFIKSSYSSKKQSAAYGDIIYVKRVAYRHYGVFISNDTIIHFAGINGDFKKPIIHATDMDGFLKGNKKFYICKFPTTYSEYKLNKIAKNSVGKFLINALPYGLIINAMSIIGHTLDVNINGIKYTLYSPEETADRAMSQLGEGKYNLLLDNCEHFAIWCKTGLHRSSQVDNVLGGMLSYQINKNYNK